jgi:hypothetical protein
MFHNTHKLGQSELSIKSKDNSICERPQELTTEMVATNRVQDKTDLNRKQNDGHKNDKTLRQNQIWWPITEVPIELVQKNQWSLWETVIVSINKL